MSYSMIRKRDNSPPTICGSQRGRALLLLTLAFAFQGIFCVAEMPATNAPAHWPTRADVTKKWGDAPLVDVNKAAQKGDQTAQLFLGYSYLSRKGATNDPVEARKWFGPLAEHGHPGAMVALGWLYRFGKGVPRDLGTAERWFQKAADQGEARGQYQLGVLYEEEERMPQKAFGFYRRAAEMGLVEAMTALYLAYRYGRGVEANQEEGKKWIVKAAETGSAYAQCLLGFSYEHARWEGSGYNRRLPPPNMPEAVLWYRKSSEQGWAGGQYRLGLCYVNGTGVEQDEERGLELIRKAADQDHAYSLVELANLYSRGIGQPRDEKDRPIHLLEHLVEGNFEKEPEKLSEAYYALIFRHEYGIGTQRDLLAAVEWYCRAALARARGFSLNNKTSYDVASKNTADDYLVASPERSAILDAGPHLGGKSPRLLYSLSLYLKAATLDRDSLTRIGNLYLTGQDTPRNPGKAWIWYSLAGRAGTGDDDVAKAEVLLTEKELAAAKKQLPELTSELQRLRKAISTDSR